MPQALHLIEERERGAVAETATHHLERKPERALDFSQNRRTSRKRSRPPHGEAESSGEHMRWLAREQS
jgi:hypothetical protein